MYIIHFFRKVPSSEPNKGKTENELIIQASQIKKKSYFAVIRSFVSRYIVKGTTFQTGGGQHNDIQRF